MPPTRPPYPPEFREEAVRLMHSAPKSVAQLSRELGVSEQTLRNWRKQAEIDAGEREGLTTEEREELGRLRRENKVLRQEREILKKAAALPSRGRTRLGEPLQAHRGGEGRISRLSDVPGVEGLSLRILRLERKRAF